MITYEPTIMFLMEDAAAMLVDEILGSSKALWPSPDNTFIAYIQFNDSAVPTAHIPVYSDPDNIYASFVDIPYPKVGHLARRYRHYIMVSDSLIDRLH